MKLYYTPGTCSLSPHIVMRELGMQFELERVDLTTQQTQSGEDFLAINPKGYVAALRLDNGEVLTEGAAIVMHLGEGSHLVPPPGTIERARLNEMLVYIAAELHQAFGPLFHVETPEEAAKARAKVFDRLTFVESLFADGRPFLLGSRVSVADFYLFVVARWSAHLELDLHRWPKLAAFIERMEARPAAQAALIAEEASDTHSGLLCATASD
ncbi:glutathione transferase GstA [Paraburkholderia bengalensis]|uniref:Glutathione transferase GstA n=1 Tax=Paraburkholderia bengalensis TaxID=2747562 RepID=A0ABU8ITU4_9BURK